MISTRTRALTLGAAAIVGALSAALFSAGTADAAHCHTHRPEVLYRAPYGTLDQIKPIPDMRVEPDYEPAPMPQPDIWERVVRMPGSGSAGR